MGSSCSNEPQYQRVPENPDKQIGSEQEPKGINENENPKPDHSRKDRGDTIKNPEYNHSQQDRDTIVNNLVSKLEQTKPKMSNLAGKKPTRTISVVKKEEDDERLKRHPQIKGVLVEFDDVRQHIDDLLSKKDFDEYEELHKLFTDKIIQPFITHSNNEQRLMMGDHLAKIGFVKSLVELYQHILEDNDLRDGISPNLDEEDGSEPYYEVIVDIRTILWNFSDTSKDFGLAISAETTLFQDLVKDLQITFKEGLDSLSSGEFSFNSAVAIITNCGRAGVTKSSFDVTITKKENDELKSYQVHMVDALIPFLKSKEQFVKLTTLMALSYMVNEDQNKFLTADTSLFDFLLDMIKLAMKDKERRYSGFSVHELIDGLAGLSKSDDNKLKIMEKKDTYPLLKKSVMNKKSDEEQLAAVRAIWELAFAVKNKERFSADKELMAQMEALQNHKNLDLANSAGRALFVINPANEANLMKSVDDKKSRLEDPEQEHIMISYQWSNQKTILQIKDKLRSNGFPVWIDVDFMEGSMLQMMASAIEKAAVVLICYSEKYKDSKNCRTEAEYAFAQDKQIVPVLLQNRYRPDGWLGILIGSKKFYDFSGKYDFEKKFFELKFELDGLMFQKNQRKSSIHPVRAVMPTAAPADDKIGILDWKKKDMENWLQQNNLQAFSGLRSLTGEQLGFLYKLFRRAPDFFYRCLEEKLGLKSLEDLMNFDKALEKLSRDNPDINKLLQ